MSVSIADSIVAILNSADAAPIMDQWVLVSQRTGPDDLEQSTEYRWNDFIPAFEQMAKTGIAGGKFTIPDVRSGLVNIGLFLAQSMHETIQYNACDENNVSHFDVVIWYMHRSLSETKTLTKQHL